MEILEVRRLCVRYVVLRVVQSAIVEVQGHFHSVVRERLAHGVDMAWIAEISADLGLGAAPLQKDLARMHSRALALGPVLLAGVHDLPDVSLGRKDRAVAAMTMRQGHLPFAPGKDAKVERGLRRIAVVGV